MHSARKLIAVFTVLVFSLTTFIPTFAGAAAAATSTLVINSLTFTAKTFKDFFSYVAWLALQYSYSGRLALRASDAWGM